MIVAKMKTDGSLESNNFKECTILKNLMPNPSFEQTKYWVLESSSYSTVNPKFGNRCIECNPAVLAMNTLAMPKPILNHIYYGARWIKTDGNLTAGDVRYEWFSGDGVGLNFVFAVNAGNFPEWTKHSSVIKINAVNGTNYIWRCFTVNASVKWWFDGCMLVDLTESFGVGNEPTKEWCDANIPFFENTWEYVYPTDINKNGIHGELHESYVLDNMIQDADFEIVNGNWDVGYNATFIKDTTEFHTGNSSLKCTPTDATAPESYINTIYTIPYNKDHSYYCMVMVKSTSDKHGTQIYFPLANPYPQNWLIVNSTWQKSSLYVGKNSGVVSGNYYLRLDNDNAGANVTMWFDSIVLVDLTKSFGVGNEPTKEWCDKNIPFFKKRYEYILPNVNIKTNKISSSNFVEVSILQ